MNEELVPLSEAKIRFHEIVRKLPERSIMLLKRGRPVGMMLAYESYESMLARLEDLEDRLAVYEARDDSGVSVPWEKLKAESGQPHQ